MRNYLKIVFILVLLITFSTTALAINIGIEPNNEGMHFKEVTISGKSIPNSLIFIKVMDMQGNIIFFDNVHTEVDGSYKCTFKISNLDSRNLKVVTGNGTQVTEQELILKSNEKEDNSFSNDLNTKYNTREISVILLIDGKEQTLDTVSIIEEGREEILEIQIDSEMLIHKIGKALKENIFKIHVSDSEIDKIKGIFRGDIINRLSQNKYIIIMNTENAEYKIPAEEIGIEQLASNLGVSLESLEDIEVKIQFDMVNESYTKENIDKVKNLGYEIIVQPIEFKITGSTTISGEAREVEVTKFSSYVQRILKIPDDIRPSVITTGIIINEDGTPSHIPTIIFEEDGSWYAKLSSLTNSSYAVIRNPIKMYSVEAHWSKEHVNDMASRIVIKYPGRFIPNDPITRGEFAEYITKALGIYRTNVGMIGNFNDVNKANESAAAIAIATEYEIIQGYPDGTFRPKGLISREEAMTMYARAMDIVGLREINNNKIYAYKDYSEVSEWAFNEVKKTLSIGVFKGRANDIIDSKGTFTYAEAATALRNLLIEAGLISK